MIIRPFCLGPFRTMHSGEGEVTIMEKDEPTETDLQRKMENIMHKPIDDVTVQRLDVALRLCDIEIRPEILDLIIDLVEAIEDKGGDLNLMDIAKIKLNSK